MLLAMAALVRPAMAQVPAAAAPATVVPPALPKPPKKTATANVATPNNERVVTIAAIDKRTGATRSYIGKPGQSFVFGALTVQVRACEATPPWEQALEGAFLLIDETIGRLAPKRIYSGWMFAQSPSLHPLEHARYDIWVKSSTMRFPDTGPDTVVAAKSVSGNVADPARSTAKKSAETANAEPNRAR